MVIFHCTKCGARLKYDGYDTYTCPRCNKVQSRGKIKRSDYRRFHSDTEAAPDPTHLLSRYEDIEP